MLLDIMCAKVAKKRETKEQKSKNPDYGKTFVYEASFYTEEAKLKAILWVYTCK